jgi:hypothetical protein
MIVALTSRHGHMIPWVYVVLSARRKICFIMIKNSYDGIVLPYRLSFDFPSGAWLSQYDTINHAARHGCGSDILMECQLWVPIHIHSDPIA